MEKIAPSPETLTFFNILLFAVTEQMKDKKVLHEEIAACLTILLADLVIECKNPDRVLKTIRDKLDIYIEELRKAKKGDSGSPSKPRDL